MRNPDGHLISGRQAGTGADLVDHPLDLALADPIEDPITAAQHTVAELRSLGIVSFEPVR